MTEPLVSVKMITYNHAPYIAQAIEGVLQQKTDFPFELVIGEDCSTDGAREIVFEYQEKYPDIIRVITSDKNVGAKKNNYRTSQACRGKYVAFCEGDDYWHHPSKLQKQVDYLENHPECGLVYSSYDVYHPQSKKRISDFVKYRNWTIPRNVTLSDFVDEIDGIGLAILTCTVMVRRDVWEEVRALDPYLHQSDYFLMGDTQLWAEMSTKTRFHYIPESLATHIITEESATRSKDITKALRFIISGAEMKLYLCSKYNFPQRMRDRYENVWNSFSLRLALHSRDVGLADEVRSRQKTFALGDWFRYFGAKYLVIHFTYRTVSFLLSLFRKKNNQWL
jgi:glycosyltransferase involved in cell wall biosynthesis